MGDNINVSMDVKQIPSVRVSSSSKWTWVNPLQRDNFKHNTGT